MVEIHERFKREEYRFCLVGADKSPLETGWQLPDNSYHFHSPRLQQHLANGGNFGIVCGRDFSGRILVGLDFDDEKTQNEVVPLLPETLTCKSGGRGLMHKYFYLNSDDSDKSFRIKDNSDENIPVKNRPTLIDFQCAGTQIICPSSRGANALYAVENSAEIATMSRAELMAILSPYMTAEEMRDVGEKDKWEKVTGPADTVAQLIKAKIPVSTVLAELGIKTSGSRGNTNCPNHSSKSGKCLSYDDFKGVWHCFHCDASGDIFTLWQDRYGVDFPTAKKILAVRAGIVEPPTSTEPKAEDILPSEMDKLMAEIKPMSVFISEGVPKIQWIIDSIIPSFGLTIFAGAGGSFKSWAAMELCWALANGKDWFGYKNLTGSPINTCYIDEEMGKITTVFRFSAINAGHRASNDAVSKIYGSIFNDLKIDSDRARMLPVLVEKYGIKLIVIDSLARVVTGEENSADYMKMMQSKIKEHLWSKYPDVAVVLIHHAARDEKRKGLASVRGSGDIINQSEGILLFTREDSFESSGFQLNMVRSRNSDYNKVTPIWVKVSSDEKGEEWIRFETNQCKAQIAALVTAIKRYLIKNKDEIGEGYLVRKDICEALSTPEHTIADHPVRDALNYMETVGIVSSSKGHGFTVNWDTLGDG